MLRAITLGVVTRFELARTLAGRGRYWTAAYLVGDTLIDSGCAHTARELVNALAHVDVRAILNTHSHEDHIGGNGPLRQSRPEIATKIRYLEELGDRVLERRRSGASVGQIVRELLGPPLLLEAITLGHFSRRALVRSFLSRTSP